MIDVEIKDKKLSETFEVRGVWFISSNDINNGTHGILKYSNEKITLELIGVLNENLEQTIKFFNEYQDYETVYGFTVKGEYISLYNCTYSEANEHYPGLTVLRYRVNSFLVGGLHTKEEILFRKSYISLTNFQKWLGKKVVISTFNNDKKLYEIDNNELKDDLMEINIPSKGITLKECYSINYKNGLNELNINSDRYLEYITKDKNKLENNLIEINKIRKLLSFLILAPVRFEKIIIDAEGLLNHEGAKYDSRTRFSYFYRQLGEPTELSRDQYLFNYKDIKDNIEDIFMLWIEKYDDLEEVYNLLFKDMYIDCFEEMIFLNSAKALEVFHRTLLHGEFEPAKDGEIDEYRILLTEFIKENISKESQQYFLDRINYEGETGFGNRVKQLLKLMDDNTLKYLIKKENRSLSDSKKRFAAEIYKTRNYLTHKDKKKYEDSLVIKEPIKRIIASYQIKMIITILIAKEIGIDEYETLKQLSRSSKFEMIQNYLNKKG